MDGRTNERTNQRTNEPTNGRTDIRITIYPRNFVCGGYNKITFKLQVCIMQNRDGVIGKSDCNWNVIECIFRYLEEMCNWNFFLSLSNKFDLKLADLCRFWFKQATESWRYTSCNSKNISPSTLKPLTFFSFGYLWENSQLFVKYLTLFLYTKIKVVNRSL